MMDLKRSSSLGFDIHQAAMENVFIGISGLIGAGKTTLATALAERLHLPVYFEPVKDNEYLADFYRDIKTYSFPMQIYLLNARFKQQQQIIWQGKGGVQDRTIYEDSIFAKMLRDSGLMDDRDYRTYVTLFQHMSNFMKKPNIIVHLDVSPQESLKRIQSRNREIEKGITLEYLTNLYAAYDVFLRDISRIIPVIKVDYERFRSTEEMVDAIVKLYKSMCNIRNVSWDGDKSSADPSDVLSEDSPSPPLSLTPKLHSLSPSKRIEGEEEKKREEGKKKEEIPDISLLALSSGSDGGQSSVASSSPPPSSPPKKSNSRSGGSTKRGKAKRSEARRLKKQSDGGDADMSPKRLSFAE